MRRDAMQCDHSECITALILLHYILSLALSLVFCARRPFKVWLLLPEVAPPIFNLEAILGTLPPALAKIDSVEALGAAPPLVVDFALHQPRLWHVARLLVHVLFVDVGEVDAQTVLAAKRLVLAAARRVVAEKGTILLLARAANAVISVPCAGGGGGGGALGLAVALGVLLGGDLGARIADARCGGDVFERKGR